MPKVARLERQPATTVRANITPMIVAAMAYVAGLLRPLDSVLRACRVKWVGEAVVALNAGLLLVVLMVLMQVWIPRMTLEVMVTLRQGPVELVLVVAGAV